MSRQLIASFISGFILATILHVPRAVHASQPNSDSLYEPWPMEMITPDSETTPESSTPSTTRAWPTATLGTPNPHPSLVTPDSMSNISYIMPTQGTITSRYGMRWGRMHRGIDIAAPVGTPILASADGTVEFSGWNSGGYGNMINLRHPNGSRTRYAHASELLVSEGDVVEQGEAIALVGSTGRSTGPHLHFEIRPSGQGAVDPMAYLGTSVAQDN